MMMQTVTMSASSGFFLRGVLHHPPAAETLQREAAILLTGLVGTRVGPHRMLFDLAERLAASGIPALRCDLTGGGYSDGEAASTRFDTLVHDALDLIAYLAETLGAESFLVAGICRGARVALAAALADRRVRHLALLSCPRFREESLEGKAARRRRSHLRTYLRKLASFGWLPRLLRGDLNFRLIGKALIDPIDRDTLNRFDALDSGVYDVGHLAARTLFLYGENDPDLEDSIAYYRERLGREPASHGDFHVIPEADAGFYAQRWHQAVLESFEEWWEGRPRE
jgi:pimeloyl-ACP methyl ester carboxylesterase